MSEKIQTTNVMDCLKSTNELLSWWSNSVTNLITTFLSSGWIKKRFCYRLN